MFDIDGCLTLPGYDKSILDIELLDKIYAMHQAGIPIAFVTGRSNGWLEKQYDEANRKNMVEIPTYIEFGLVLFKNGSISIRNSAKEFVEIRDRLITDLDIICKEKGFYFEPTTFYNDYPSHGSLWIERKHVQLSIATGPKATTPQVQHLSEIAWASHQDNVRILNHHLGVDAIPKGWSKANATEHFVSNIEETQYHWFVFGDNISDEEMMIGLTNKEFIDTKINASEDVRKKFNELGI